MQSSNRQLASQNHFTLSRHSLLFGIALFFNLASACATLRAEPRASIQSESPSPFLGARSGSPRHLPAFEPASNNLLDRAIQLESPSGEELASISARLSQFRRRVKRVTAESPDELARVLFEQLHREFLTGRFDAFCSGVGETLRLGNYNCLTASTLYVDACRSRGLTAHLVASPGHVRVKVRTGARTLWVELTQTQWRPVSIGAAHEAEIDDRATLARLVYNRGTLFARQEAYRLAVRQFRRSLSMDPSYTEASDNLVATLNNWAIEQIYAGNYRHAKRLVESGLKHRQHDPNLLETLEYLKQRQG